MAKRHITHAATVKNNAPAALPIRIVTAGKPVRKANRPNRLYLPCFRSKSSNTANPFTLSPRALRMRKRFSVSNSAKAFTENSSNSLLRLSPRCGS